MWAELPSVRLPDGKTATLTESELGPVPLLVRPDCSFGLGKGFHGIHSREGRPLGPLLQARFAGVEPGSCYVLATAPDGYRSLFSGGELFLAQNPGNILIVESEDGKPLGKGDGKYKVSCGNDFYVDRCIRSLQNLTCVVVK